MGSTWFYKIVEHPVFWIIHAVIAVLYIVAPHGIGLTHDSSMYVFAAQGIYEQGAYLDPSAQPMVLYPPLYSLLLSWSYGLHIPVQAWALLINVLSHAILVICCKSESETFRNKTWQYALLLCISYGLPMVQNAVFLWSDSLFIALLMLSGICLRHAQSSDRNVWKWLLASACLASASIYVRYIGVAWVLAAVLYWIVPREHHSFKKQFWQATVYGLVCLVSFLCWEYRNYQLAGIANHPYDDGIYTFIQNLLSMLSWIGTYIIPGNVWETGRIMSGIFLMLIVLFSRFYKRTDSVVREDLYLYMVLSYVVLFAGLNTRYEICDWDDRYLSPVYPFIFLLIFSFLDRLIKPGMAAIIALLLCLYPMVRYFKNASDWRKSGMGFNSIEWKSNSLLRWVRSSPYRYCISNNPMPLLVPGAKTAYYRPVSLDPRHTIVVWWNQPLQLNYHDWPLEKLSETYILIPGPEFLEGKIVFLKSK